jgi:transposase
MMGYETGVSGQRGDSIINMIPANKIYICCGRVDLRRSIDGLAAMVQQVFKLDPCDRSLFLFCGKRSDRFKALYFDGDGFILLYKRLERAGYQWPRRELEAQQISERQLRWLLEGLSIEQPKALLPVAPKYVV